MADDGLRSRAQGCWFGQLTGDALGSIVEFKPAGQIAARYPHGLHEMIGSPVWGTLPGQPTDDSELALELARSLVRTGTYDDERVAVAYADWYDSPPFDIGSTTRIAMSAMSRARKNGASAATAARKLADTKSEANGALMRHSPLAIWGHMLPAAALDDIARRDTTLTHPNRVCQDASASFVVALAAVIRDGLSAEAAYAVATTWDAARGASPSVSRALRDARTAPPANYAMNMGHVPLAVQNAWYQALHAPSFEAGVVATVMAGGDTDTNGAIAGALLGALHGVDAIPAQWRDAVLACRPETGAAGVQKPRPRRYWPTDALELAAQLAGIPA